VDIDTFFEISGSDWLEYTIHFQNVGNDRAHNVILIDTLSAYLDLSSIEILSKSHPLLDFEISNGNVAKFNFYNIMLPDSATDYLASNGFVKYRVKYLSTVPLFETIENFADIYFDYNAPVRTNTASTYHDTIFLNSNENEQMKMVHVYPNPAKYLIYVSFHQSKNTVSTITFYDLTGKQVYREDVYETGDLNVPVSLENLQTGIYFIELSDGDRTYTTKVLKH
jgi:hypothetical protein